MTSAKTTTELEFTRVLRERLADCPEFAGVAIHESQRSGKLAMPAVIVACTAAPAADGPEIPTFTGTVHVMVCTDIDEDLQDVDEAHRQRLGKVEEVLRGYEDVIAAIHAAGLLHVYMYSVSDATSTAEGRRYSDNVELTVHGQLLS